MLKIIGAKGIIKDVDKFLKEISSFAEQHNIIIQVFNADLIFNKNHLISAVEHAFRAIDRKINTTNSVEMEILLYSSGERQLKIAIPKMGVKKGVCKTAIVFTNHKDKKGKISDDLTNKLLQILSLKRDDKVLKGDKNTLKRFGLGNQEISTVSESKYEDLMLEKIAMVDLII
jgi:tRNA threonylcarbamoyladenosine modification (KEOPS) complex Cgi121 subunit